MRKRARKSNHRCILLLALTLAFTLTVSISTACNFNEFSPQETQYTLLIYLNGGGDHSGKEGGEDLSGGETVFYTGKRDNEVCGSFSPVQGWCLFHRHGDRCLTHEGALVSKGTKYILRTDIVFSAE